MNYRNFQSKLWLMCTFCLTAFSTTNIAHGDEQVNLETFTNNIILEIRKSECRGILDKFREYESIRYAVVNNKSYKINRTLNAKQLHPKFAVTAGRGTFAVRFDFVVRDLSLKIDGKKGNAGELESVRSKLLKQVDRASCGVEFIENEGSVCSCSSN